MLFCLDNKEANINFHLKSHERRERRVARVANKLDSELWSF